MSSQSYDICIVGGGIYGLSTALEMRRRANSVILLEAGEIPSTLASSYDISKIVRIEYGSDEEYMEMAEQALDGWRNWNSKWKSPLFHESGVCMMTTEEMKPGGFEYESYQLLLKRGHKPVRLSRSLISNNYPTWQGSKFGDGYYNNIGGYVESGNVIKRLYKEALESGVEVRINSKVVDLDIQGGQILGVKLLNKKDVIANKILLATGAWTHVVLPELTSKLKSTGHPVFHLHVKQPANFSASKFPVFTADISKSGWYGFPFHPKEKVLKIANHGIGIDIHPELDERKILESQEVNLRVFLTKNLPMLSDAKIVYRRLCLYSDTKDEHFWICKHPTIDQLYIAAGGSGHGFKFGPILGPIISDAIEGINNRWLAKFNWRTFDEDTKGEEAARHHG